MNPKFLLALVLLGLLFFGCKKGPATSGEPAAIPVDATVVKSETVPVEIKAIGTVEPISSVQLKSKVQGEIEKVHFEDGAYVKEGEILFTIDPRPFEAILERAKANLAIAESQAANAQEQVERYSTLIDRGSASQEQFSQLKSTAKAQESEVTARQSDVAEAQLSRDWTSIVAPISGRAGAALSKKGNIVQANSDVLVVIHQMEPIYVNFSVPETALAKVRRERDENTLDVKVFYPESGDLLDSGELTFVDNAVDSESGMIGFKGTFLNKEKKLWPGQFVEVLLELAQEQNALVIPTSAVMESQEGSQVFVVENGIANLRKIQVVRTWGNSSVIQSGLTPGETVVTNGQLRIIPGAKVSTNSAKNSVQNKSVSK